MIKKLLFSFLIILTLLQTGCWNRRELEDIGLVMGMAIDKSDSGEFECYFIIVKPALLRQGGGEAAERASVVFESKGRTLFEAIRATLTESPRKLFFGQQLTLIITENALQQEDVGDMLDLILRDHEFRRNIKFFVTPNKGEEILSIQPELENLSAREINSIADKSKSSAFYPNININDFTKTLASDVPNPVAPLLIAKEGIQQRRYFEESTEQTPLVPFVEGAAVFQGERYVGQIDKLTTRGLLFATNKAQSTIYVVHSGIEEKPTSVEIISSKAKMEPKLEGDMPSINLKVKIEANVGENMGELNYAKEKNLKELEKQTAEAIQKEIERSIDKAQLDLGVDFFGFGQAIHRKYKDYWKEHKNQWPQIFPDVTITVDVEVKIRRLGLQTEPLNVD